MPNFRSIRWKIRVPPIQIDQFSFKIKFLVGGTHIYHPIGMKFGSSYFFAKKIIRAKFQVDTMKNKGTSHTNWSIFIQKTSLYGRYPYLSTNRHEIWVILFFRQKNNMCQISGRYVEKQGYLPYKLINFHTKSSLYGRYPYLPINRHEIWAILFFRQKKPPIQTTYFRPITAWSTTPRCIDRPQILIISKSRLFKTYVKISARLS